MSPAETHDISRIFIELGVIITGLSILTRLASRWGLSTIPLYLLAGLAFGIGAEIGVLLLLFMIGLEYSGEELRANLRSGLVAGSVDFLLNFPPGLIAGLWLGWNPLAAVLLGGVTYISSSGVIAKVLMELGRMTNAETPTILTILVLEDLAMAVYLPLVAVLLVDKDWISGLIAVSVALITAGIVLVVAVRYGTSLSRWLVHELDEVILFTIFGLVLLVAGVAQRLQVSSAIGAFLVGIALSGPIVKQAHRLLGPLRDLFAATFFLFFGLQIDPHSLPPVLLQAISLGIITTLTKLLTGWWASRRARVDAAGSLRAGAALVARGEFSIVIAGLGMSAGVEPQLGSVSAAYVLFLAVLGPILARTIEPISTMIVGRRVS